MSVSQGMLRSAVSGSNILAGVFYTCSALRKGRKDGGKEEEETLGKDTEVGKA